MKRLFFFLILIAPFVSHAQKQWNTWYFGQRAGLDFNSGIPVPLTDGTLSALEGCASISDKNTGSFLFSTDGTSVYNKNNVAMTNGTWLGGNYSSTQGVLIVPKPGTDSIFYIFTVAAQGGNVGSDSGLEYNIVDLRLNNGLGDVTLKRQRLIAPTTEKLCGTYACNGRDIWVLTHQWNTDAFYAYLVTDTGISQPVISHTGIVHSDGLNLNRSESSGYMKVSPNGKKLALVTGVGSNVVQIFDFDNSIAKISNPVTDTGYPRLRTVSESLYGLSFSPDNSKLYVSYHKHVTSLTGWVYQYNLLAGDSNAIKASRTVVYNENDGATAQVALQCGPDGKIYVCNIYGKSLDVINNPNELGAACNYVHNSLSLGGKETDFGLPNIIENYSPAITSNINILPPSPSICAGQAIKLTASGGNNYVWSPAAGLSATTGSEVIANPAVSTTYLVTGSGGLGCMAVGTDTVTVNSSPFSSFLSVINGMEVSFNPDSSGGGVSSYYWDFGDSTSASADISPVHSYNRKDIYHVCLTVYNNSNCSYTICKNINLKANGIKDLADNAELQLYPNPAGETLMVKGNISQGSSLQVFNVLGQPLITTDNLRQGNQAGIDVRNLAPGVYLLQYKCSGGNIIKWFVKK